MVTLLNLSVLSMMLLGISKCSTPGNVKLYSVECGDECEFIRRDEDGETVEKLDVRTEVNKDQWGAMTLDDILILIEMVKNCEDIQ